jgi:hypothetical protein
MQAAPRGGAPTTARAWKRNWRASRSLGKSSPSELSMDNFVGNARLERPLPESRDSAERLGRFFWYEVVP